MIIKPEKYIEKFAELSDILTIHYEVSKDTLAESLKSIKNNDKVEIQQPDSVLIC